MARYINRYRIASARAQWWNYGWNGAYFITICTQNRKHYFGEIIDKKMVLSPTGIIADIFWHEITNHSSGVDLGDFVVMPDHIHGILIINRPAGGDEEMEGRMEGKKEGLGEVQPLHATAPQPPQPHFPSKNPQMAAISPKSNTISSIIRSYKSAVTKHANRLGFENGWQTRFHDHIIRNDAEYQRISNYIISNPENWGRDKFQSGK